MIPIGVALLWLGAAFLLALAVITGIFVLSRHVLMARVAVDVNRRITPADRAEGLLRAVLDDDEYEQLTKRGYFDLRSPSEAERIYRIPRYCGLVRMYEHGVVARELCVQSVDPLPTADILAMHKIMIQGNEQEYLAYARKYPPTYRNLRYRP